MYLFFPHTKIGNAFITPSYTKSSFLWHMNPHVWMIWNHEVPLSIELYVVCYVFLNCVSRNELIEVVILYLVASMCGKPLLLWLCDNRDSIVIIVMYFSEPQHTWERSQYAKLMICRRMSQWKITEGSRLFICVKVTNWTFLLWLWPLGIHKT